MEIFDQVNVYSVTLRLTLSLVLGGLLGMEREQKRRPAGFGVLPVKRTIKNNKFLYLGLHGVGVGDADRSVCRRNHECQ